MAEWAGSKRGVEGKEGGPGTYAVDEALDTLADGRLGGVGVGGGVHDGVGLGWGSGCGGLRGRELVMVRGGREGRAFSPGRS